MRLAGGIWRTGRRKVAWWEGFVGEFLRDSESSSLAEEAQRSSGMHPSYWTVESDLMPGLSDFPVQDTFHYTIAGILHT